MQFLENEAWVNLGSSKVKHEARIYIQVAAFKFPNKRKQCGIHS